MTRNDYSDSTAEKRQHKKNFKKCFQEKKNKQTPTLTAFFF